MARFDPNFLDDIRSRVPISQLIGTRVSWDRKKTNAPRGDYWAPCPFHGEKSPSFHCEDQKGRYHCFGCGVSGDHFKFLVELDGMTFPRAVETVADMAGLSMPKRAELTPAEKAEFAKKQREREQRQAKFEADRKRDDERRTATAGGVWKDTVPIPGTIGEAYLNYRCPGLARHITGDTVRFHAGLPYPKQFGDKPGLHPCLIGRVVGVDGKGIAVWRIYLAQGGQGKLSGVNPKLGLGPAAGGAVRLGGMAKHIGLAEGIETAVAVRELGETKPIWAGLSTSGVSGLILPDGVERCTVFPDPDGAKVKTRYRHDGTKFIGQSPGYVAAGKLVERYPGRVTIAPAAVNDDYLELLQKMRGIPVR